MPAMATRMKQKEEIQRSKKSAAFPPGSVITAACGLAVILALTSHPGLAARHTTEKPSPNPATLAAGLHHVLDAFDYKGVTLDDGALRRQFDEVRDFYLRIPNDDLLKGFRKRAALPAPGVNLGGWYTADIGNIFGQILSGLSRMHRATGDPACLAKVNTLVSEWGKCIGQDGYPFFSTNPSGAAYTYDKLVGGLVDAFLYCGNRDAAGYLSRITDWAEKNINRVRDYANADGAGAPRAGWSEWYTLGENLYRAYLATGETRYRDFAAVWEYGDYWGIYAADGDIFAPRKDGRATKAYHAYSHVNTLSSAGAAYEVTGETRYLTTLKNAYSYLQAQQCFATGGFGPDEILAPHGELLSRLRGTHNTVETQCSSWAGFKVSRYLMMFTGDARYGDWIERLLLNCIGASLPNAADGRVFYYADYNPSGAKKVLYDSGWSCCSGSRPMAVAAYHDLIYFHNAADLFVNLYAPSSVEWNGVRLMQRTRFPEEPTAEFTVDVPDGRERGGGAPQASGGAAPAAARLFALNLRAPSWLTGPMTIEINGKRITAKVNDKHWVTMRRAWHDGDKVVVTLPMAFRVEAFDVKGYPAAICYGPVVMAVRSPSGNPAAAIDLKQLALDMLPSVGEPLTFHLRTDANILLRPFYAFKENEPYFLYLDPSAK